MIKMTKSTICHYLTSPLLSTVISCQHKFLGHILRMDKDEPTNIYALCEPSNARRPPGRPHKSISSQVQEWIDPNKNFSKDDIMRTAQD